MVLIIAFNIEVDNNENSLSTDVSKGTENISDTSWKKDGEYGIVRNRIINF